MTPLVVRFGALGDMVILLGMIEALHRRFGTLVDVVSSGPWAQSLLEGQPGIGRLHLIRSRRTTFAFSPQQWRLVRELRARAAGPVWLCDREAQARGLLRRGGVADEWLVDIGICPRQSAERHLDRLLRFAQQSPPALHPLTATEAADVVRDIEAPRIRILPEWRADVDMWLRGMGIAERPLLLVQVGNKRTMRWWSSGRHVRNTKYWPEERWATLIRWLSRRHPDAAVLLLGVPVEASLNERVRRLAPSDRLFNVAGQMTLHRLLALQERAFGMVSVDTGPAHSAAALDCPLVVLFGKADVIAYSPRSRGGAVKVIGGSDEPGGGMLDISVQDVEDAWEQIQPLAHDSAHLVLDMPETNATPGWSAT